MVIEVMLALKPGNPEDLRSGQQGIKGVGNHEARETRFLAKPDGNIPWSGHCALENGDQESSSHWWFENVKSMDREDRKP